MRIINNPNYINKCLAEYNIFEFIMNKKMEVFAVEYKAGEYIRQPGSSRGEKWLQFVVDGALHLFIITSDGKIISERYGTWHSHIGESEMILERDLNVFAKAITEVRVLAVSVDKYKKELLNDPEYLLNALRRNTEIMCESVSKEISQDNLQTRILNSMRYHCPDGTLKGVELYASIFHCSPRQLQRVLNKLVEEKQIEKIGKGTYKIL